MNQKTFIAVLVTGLILLFLSKTWSSNKNSHSMDQHELTKTELIKHVKLAINPEFKNWVLFSNGTYIIIEETSDEKAIENLGLEKMEEFGPVQAGGPAGDFGTISLYNTEGWVVSGHGYGMYTYVHPSELGSKSPQDYEIGIYGRNKRDKDGLNPEIICISTNGQLIIK